MIIRSVALFTLLRLSKKENVLIINKKNISKLTNAVYPEYHRVISFMVYAFQGVNVTSIGSACLMCFACPGLVDPESKD